MKVTFIDQPRTSLFEARLRSLLAADGVKGLYLASAWVRRPGLLLVSDEIAALTEKLPSRAVRGLFGVDMGGTTVEGLEAALDAFGQVRVFHSAGRRPRVFHPKLYVVERERSAVVSIGSANMTYGGLGTNFEAGVEVELDLTATDDRRFLADVERWFERHWSDDDAAVRVSATSLDKLRRDPRIWLPSERDRVSVIEPGASTDGKRPKSMRSLFSAAKNLLPAPPLPPGVETGANLAEQQPTDAVPAIPIADLSPPATRAARRVLVAYVPHDRWKQVGFNRTVTEEFFRVYKNGDPVWVQGVNQAGALLPARESALINPVKSRKPNNNHRIELPEPDERPDPKPDYGIVVVLEQAARSFRYMHLRPGDSGYSLMKRLIEAGDAFGRNDKPETKRTLTDYATLRQRWPACPLEP